MRVLIVARLSLICSDLLAIEVDRLSDMTWKREVVHSSRVYDRRLTARTFTLCLVEYVSGDGCSMREGMDMERQVSLFLINERASLHLILTEILLCQESLSDAVSARWPSRWCFCYCCSNCHGWRTKDNFPIPIVSPVYDWLTEAIRASSSLEELADLVFPEQYVFSSILLAPLIQWQILMETMCMSNARRYSIDFIRRMNKYSSRDRTQEAHK